MKCPCLQMLSYTGNTIQVLPQALAYEYTNTIVASLIKREKFLHQEFLLFKFLSVTKH